MGRERIDAYAWMKFIPQSGTRTLGRLPESLREHLSAEMRYSREVLGPLAPAIDWFHRRMSERAPEVDEPTTGLVGRWRYGFSLSAGGAHRVFYRSRPEGQTQILFDEASRAAGYAYYRATGHQASPDDRYFAWAEDVIGNDRHRICLLDVDDGTVRVIVASDAFGGGAFTFSPSSAYLFWIWRDEHSRPTRLYRVPVAGGDSVLVYEEHDPAIFMSLARTAEDGFVSLSLSGSGISEVRLIAAGAETGFAHAVRTREPGVRYQVVEWDNDLLMLIDSCDASGGKLVRLDPSDLSVCEEVVACRPGVSIMGIQPFANALVRLERVNGMHRLVLMHDDAQEIQINFEGAAYCVDLVPSQPYETDRVRVVYQTPADPPCWIDISLASGQRQVVGRVKPVDFDTAKYRVERIYARAPDGEAVPITVLSRRDAEGPQPLLLTGYGAYGIASEPRFSLPATVLVDAGFRYAIAHVRGGSEKGRCWYQDGCREKKRNSMTDFIACARHLLQVGYAAPGKIVAQGISAGGLLVCGAMNLEPELWAGVIAQVPFVDMLNTMSDANHPLVPLFRPDWGDPLADPEAYDYIAAISPYENVGRAAYPPVLCTAGLKDDRVPYWEPAKLLANIRHHSTAMNPSILMLDPDSGHQGTDNQDSMFAQAAVLWAFACRCTEVSTPV